jgi:uncharacterized protein YecE (DUF72 family)
MDWETRQGSVHDAMIVLGCCGWTEGREKYFQDFSAVELQTTFYEPPTPELACKWRSEAPADFAFTMKAWQLITHPASSPTYKRLKHPIHPARALRYGGFQPTEEVHQAWRQTLDIVKAVRAAAVVFQCPPSFVPSEQHVANLRAFFEKIERGEWVAAWEPRGNWPQETVRGLCQDLKLVHCVDPFAGEPAWGKAVYFRLHGKGGNNNYKYSAAELKWLCDICRRRLDDGHSPVYVMFNNIHMRDDALLFRKLWNPAT